MSRNLPVSLFAGFHITRPSPPRPTVEKSLSDGRHKVKIHHNRCVAESATIRSLEKMSDDWPQKNLIYNACLTIYDVMMKAQKRVFILFWKSLGIWIVKTFHCPEIVSIGRAWKQKDRSVVIREKTSVKFW